MTASIAHPKSAALELVASPIKLSATPARLRRHPPLLGEHTDEVLAELGLTPEERLHLRQAGVTGPMPT
jgi:crotonobetainyl-CoA:carnitine CoA-transferase CaiB-like acyl-CoA transferase